MRRIGIAADHAAFELKVQRDAFRPDFARGNDGRFAGVVVM
jgi:hypothetical protein